MEVVLNRNFKVKGNIRTYFQLKTTVPGETVQLKGIEVQLWVKVPTELIFLERGVTDESGDFEISFEVNSPADYITDGKIKNVFIEAYYNGVKLNLNPSFDLLNGLVAYWTLDQWTGDVATDVSGNGNHGNLVGTSIPSWTDGKISNGLQINGGSSNDVFSSLQIPNSSDFDFGTGDFTISFWFNLTTVDPGIPYTLFDTGFPNPGCFLIEPVSNMIYIYNGLSDFYSSSFVLPTGTWYHFVFRRLNGVMQMFLNGAGYVQVAGLNSFTPLANISFGSRLSYARSLNGKLDEIGVWKGKGLSNDEVLALYNDGNGLQYPFNL